MSNIPHPALAGVVAGHFENPIRLPGKEIIFAPATLLTGTAYKAGSVLGRIINSAATAAAKSGGNTGNGTFVIDATNPSRIGAKVGVYQLRVVDVPAAHGSVWKLTDPEGYVVDVPVVAGSGGTYTVDSDIKGVITDGGTDFIVGDGFDITVPAGSNKLKLAAAAAQDGSAEPFAILLEDVDATSADKNCPVAVEGAFNEEALVFGVGHTADTVRYPLRKLGIHIRTMKYSG
jgi:hypothetical protein